MIEKKSIRQYKTLVFILILLYFTCLLLNFLPPLSFTHTQRHIDTHSLSHSLSHSLTLSLQKRRRWIKKCHSGKLQSITDVLFLSVEANYFNSSHIICKTIPPLPEQNSVAPSQTCHISPISLNCLSSCNLTRFSKNTTDRGFVASN